MAAGSTPRKPVTPLRRIGRIAYSVSAITAGGKPNDGSQPVFASTGTINARSARLGTVCTTPATVTTANATRGRDVTSTATGKLIRAANPSAISASSRWLASSDGNP